MTKTLLFGALIALAASPALAQDAMQETKDEMATEMIEEGQEMMKEGAEIMEDGADKVEDGVEMATEPSDLTVVTPDTVVLDAPLEPVVAEPMMDKPVIADAEAPVTRVEIACPAGTTAQDDGTCMITGDYEGDE